MTALDDATLVASPYKVTCCWCCITYLIYASYTGEKLLRAEITLLCHENAENGLPSSHALFPLLCSFPLVLTGGRDTVCKGHHHARRSERLHGEKNVREGKLSEESFRPSFLSSLLLTRHTHIAPSWTSPSKAQHTLHSLPLTTTKLVTKHFLFLKIVSPQQHTHTQQTADLWKSHHLPWSPS